MLSAFTIIVCVESTDGDRRADGNVSLVQTETRVKCGLFYELIYRITDGNAVFDSCKAIQVGCDLSATMFLEKIQNIVKISNYRKTHV